VPQKHANINNRLIFRVGPDSEVEVSDLMDIVGCTVVIVHAVARAGSDVDRQTSSGRWKLQHTTAVAEMVHSYACLAEHIHIKVRDRGFLVEPHVAPARRFSDAASNQ
jgi:hypothetical protein